MANQVISSASYQPLADGVYVYVAPPSANALPSVVSGLAGIVGTASWGPTNKPVFFSSVAELYDAFGISTGAANEIVTEAVNALEQNSSFVGIRVAKNDSAGVFKIVDQNGATLFLLTGYFTGSRINGATVTISAGSASTPAAPLARVSIAIPNGNPELYDNIPVGGTMAAALANIIAAINEGTATQSSSVYFIASLPTTGATTLTTWAGYTGGTGTTFSVTTPGVDGSAVATQDLIGLDGDVSRSGMYALRGTGVDCFILAGVFDPTALETAGAFAQSELAFAIGLLSGPGYAGNLSGLVALQQANGAKQVYLDTIANWVTIRDASSGLLRLVSPLGHKLGSVCSLPPEASPGNKPYAGFKTILSTERDSVGPLSTADLGILAGSGIGFICKQMPRGGGLYGNPHGRNSSGISGQDSIAYPRFTNYLIKGLFQVLGPYVDELQSGNTSDLFRTKMKGSVSTWLQALENANRIQGYNVTADTTNNSAASIAAGFAYLLILVLYMGEARYIVPTLQGGTNVTLATAPAVSIAA